MKQSDDPSGSDAAPESGAAPAGGVVVPGGLNDEAFRRLVEGARDYAIFMLSPDGVVSSWNAGAQRIKGYAADEILGRHFSIFYPREALDIGWPEEELRRAREIGRFEDEGWRLRKDGTRFWANVTIAALRGPAGELLGYSKITRDLTERRENEERLRQSEHNLRLLIEGVADYAIFMLNPQGIVTSWNLGATRIKGYSASEIIGRHFSIFYPQDALDAGWPAEELRRARTLGRFEDEGWRVRKDGTLMWANVVITAIHDADGELLGYSKITRDLSERRRHERRLTESEENLRLLVEGVKDHAIFALDAEGVVRDWNAGAERVLGHRRDQIVGCHVSLLYTEDDIAARKPQDELAAARDSGFAEAAGWRVKADGTLMWADVTLTALRQRDGSLRGYVQIVRDLSERRRVHELETEGRRINEFIAMLSHELRNPLGPIRNAVAILGQVDSRPEVAGSVAMIGRQVAHLAHLVEDLLDVSRVTSGKIHLRRETLELNRLVQTAVDSVRSALDDHGHALQLQLAPGPLPVDGDATRLTQAIVNLLTNAAKYTPDGGVVRVESAAHGAVATLRVIDNGIGMSEALMRTAFDLFVQGERTLDRAEGGLGIGLALVKRIVALHGGTVAVTSAGRGRGSEFTLALPLAAAGPDTAVAAPPAVAAARPARRVLVVDDNRDAAASLAILLEMEGHEVLVAHDGEEALRLAGSGPLDAAVLDVGLPTIDGYEVARRLRAIPALRGTRLIALTGYGRDRDRHNAAEAGFDAHFVKPVDFDELVRELDR